MENKECNCRCVKELKEEVKRLKKKIKELEKENKVLRYFIGEDKI